MNNHPPKIALRFLRWFCQPELLPHLEGDLLELFEENVQQLGLRKARRMFVVDVLKLMRPRLLDKPKFGRIKKETVMKFFGQLSYGMASLLLFLLTGATLHMVIKWFNALLDSTYEIKN